tara:strand:+ start:5646 stop:5936 length:291 start_codon:yes stop_codon:yes gene_type:complete
MATNTVQLFTNQTANGSSIAAQASKTQFMTLFIDGTWDGATVIMEVSPDNTNWIAVRNNASWTDSGADNFYANEGVWMRLTVSGAGASTDLNAWLN